VIFSFDLTFVVCLYFTRRRSIDTKNETDIKVVAIMNFFSIKQIYSFDEKSIVKRSQLPLYLFSKSTVQRNPVNLLAWFSRMDELHDFEQLFL